MTYLVIALTISQGFGTWALLRFLAAKDDKHMRQIERLCNRIQAPEVAIAQSVNESSPPTFLEPIEAESDEDYWRGRKERAEMAGTDFPIDLPPLDDSDLIGVS